MPAYRDPQPRPDLTLWYGPFERRWSVLVALLVVETFLLGAAIDAERSSFRGIACTRPGVCAVELGTDLIGSRVARTFDPDTIVAARSRRTTGKSARAQLVLVDRRGGEVVLAEGSVVSELLPRLEPFFASRAPATLQVRAPASVEDWMLSSFAALVAACAAGFAARSSVRAGVRVRVEVLHGQGIVRWVEGRRTREVPIADIASVEIEHDGSRARSRARIRLMCRTGPDVALLEHFLPGGAHAEVAASLREALGIAPPSGGS